MDLRKIIRINAYIQHTGDIFLDGKKVLCVALDHSAALEDSEDNLMLTDDQLENLFVQIAQRKKGKIIMHPDNLEENAAMPGLIEGRIVHYVLQHGRKKGEHRPAIVVKDWKSHEHGLPGVVNLQVFTDYTNDFATGDGATGLVWATSVHYSEGKELGTWHWIEKA